MDDEVVKAPEIDGWKFLLFIFLPLLIIFAVLFMLYAPDKPLGGPTNLRPPMSSDNHTQDKPGDSGN